MNLEVLSWLCRTDLPKKLPWLTDQVPHLIVPGCPHYERTSFPALRISLQLYSSFMLVSCVHAGPKKIHVECNLKNEGFGNVSLPWTSSTSSPCWSPLTSLGHAWGLGQHSAVRYLASWKKSWDASRNLHIDEWKEMSRIKSSFLSFLSSDFGLSTLQRPRSVSNIPWLLPPHLPRSWRPDKNL